MRGKPSLLPYFQKSKSPVIIEIAGLFWSEWRDLNPRPLGPEDLPRKIFGGLENGKMLCFQWLPGFLAVPQNREKRGFSPQKQGDAEGMRGK